jgi:hypothetical protein
MHSPGCVGSRGAACAVAPVLHLLVMYHQTYSCMYCLYSLDVCTPAPPVERGPTRMASCVCMCMRAHRHMCPASAYTTCTRARHGRGMLPSCNPPTRASNVMACHTLRRTAPRLRRPTWLRSTLHHVGLATKLKQHGLSHNCCAGRALKLHKASARTVPVARDPNLLLHRALCSMICLMNLSNTLLQCAL